MGGKHPQKSSIQNEFSQSQNTKHLSRVVTPSPLQPLPSTADIIKPVYIARYSYAVRTAEDLGFDKGDTLMILAEPEGDWWMARSLKTNKEGYIPRNHVAPQTGYEAEDWYFGDIRSSVEAEKRLLAQGTSGAFLVWKGPNHNNSFTLSVNGESMRTYRIRTDDGGFYITRRISFPTLQNLVAHYMTDADGLPQRLTMPCTTANPPFIPSLSYKNEWEIDRSTIVLQGKLSQGNFGDIWAGMWNGTTAVAVMTLMPDIMKVKDFVQEAEVMKKIYHPNLLQLYAVCTVGEPVYIVTEVMKHGSLLEYLKNGDGRNATLLHMVDMSSQIAFGMAYLERHSYIHGHLAASNILVGEGNVCKVADYFGFAMVIKENIYRDGTKFSINWVAPEAALYNRFSIKADVWSFGILMYEIITYGAMPYPGMNNKQVLEAVDRGYRMPRPDGCPDPLYTIMLSCWKHVPEDRYSFESLMSLLDDLCVSLGPQRMS